MDGGECGGRVAARALAGGATRDAGRGSSDAVGRCGDLRRHAVCVEKS